MRRYGWLEGVISIVMLGSPVLAQSSFGDWMTGITNDKSRAFAATTNDSAASLIETCDFAGAICNWYIVADSTCKVGDLYPALGNTDNGSAHINIRCDGSVDKGKYRYLITDWKDLEELCTKSKNLGLAFPMASGRFTVYRFSLIGMAAATTAMESAVAEVKKKREEKGTGTIVL